MRAAVSRMRSALHELPGFEAIDEFDHLVSVKTHGVGELLLGEPFCISHVTQKLEVSCSQSQGSEPLCEPVSRAETELDQQKANPLAQRTVVIGA